MNTDPPQAEAARASIIVVTGVSGAGKSTVLRSLEDLGYFCIDNLPTLLAPDAVSLCAQGGIERVALGVDVRRLRQMADGAVPPVCILEFDGDLTDHLVRQGLAQPFPQW
ncbi:MAG: hypothetical protein HOO96_43725, partial [Polyangiaceae bacterium]|nr:hypothetical protein [Polyangiaceae bacterium]